MTSKSVLLHHQTPSTPAIEITNPQFKSQFHLTPITSPSPCPLPLTAGVALCHLYSDFIWAPSLCLSVAHGTKFCAHEFHSTINSRSRHCELLNPSQPPLQLPPATFTMDFSHHLEPLLNPPSPCSPSLLQPLHTRRHHQRAQFAARLSLHPSPPV
jgi:hypothetical protein